MPFKRPKYNDLTSVQKNIIANATATQMRKLAVVGGPGTGKTILALQIIMDSIKSSSNSLFIVYNRPLSNFLKNELDKENNPAMVMTFHSWIYTFLKDVALPMNGEINVDIEKSLQTNKFVYDWNKVYRKILTLDSLKGYYDYVFIDEAQDICKDAWPIFNYIAKKLYVFYDENQKIGNELEQYYYSDSEIVDIKRAINCEDSFYDLTENFRNTIEIESVAKLFDDNSEINNITLKKITAKNHGKKPSILKIENADLVAKWILKNYDPSLSYGILIPAFSKANKFDSVLSQYKEAFENNMNERQKRMFQCYSSKTNNKYNIMDTGISLMSIIASKGLEFDVVYILSTNDIDFDISKTINRHKLYVAITRARKELYFVCDTSGVKNVVLGTLETNKAIVDEKEIKESDVKSTIDMLF